MSRIICLMGKSSSGKDTIYKRLLEEGTLGLKTIVPYTTRPIRSGERNGVEYFFTEEAGYRELKEAGKIIEERSYKTFCGLWRYFTVDDGQIQWNGQDYIVIGTLEAYLQLKNYFGQDKLLPIMIELEDGIRLERALKRERQQENPKYEEMCRRFLADCVDFSEEKIAQAGIEKRFQNQDLDKCLAEITAYILEMRQQAQTGIDN